MVDALDMATMREDEIVLDKGTVYLDKVRFDFDIDWFNYLKLGNKNTDPRHIGSPLVYIVVVHII